MWLACAFLSAALLGCYDVSKKHALRENAVLVVLLLNTLFCSLVFLVPVIGSHLGLIGTESIFYVPESGWNVQRYVLLKSCMVLSSWIFGYYGMAHLPLTLVGPINATRPVLVLLGALLIFGERLNLYQWVGVCLAVVSFFMLSRSGKREGIDFRHNVWVLCLVCAALLGALCALYDKYLMAPVDAGGAGINRMVVQSYFNFYQFFFMAMVCMLVWWRKRGNTSEPSVSFHWRNSILLISIFLSIADFAYFYALSLPGAMVSVVSMVRRSSVIVSFMLGALLFREKNLRSKFLDLILVLLGMLFLWLGSHS